MDPQSQSIDLQSAPPLPTPSPKQSFPRSTTFLLVVLGLLVIALSVFVGTQIGNKQTSSQHAEVILPTTSPTQIVVNPTALPTTVTPTPNPTVNWKTYTGTEYTFRYPQDWTLRSEENDNAVFMANKEGSVGIVFSDSQYPYGFGPGYIELKRNDLHIPFLGKTIVAKEVDSSFADFSVKDPRELHILFGTGYPIASVSDSNKSISDYAASKETILKILSSFQFIDSTKSTPDSKKLAYINSIEAMGVDANAYYKIYVDWIPNGYRIDNPSTELTIQSFSKKPTITMQTFSHKQDGGFNYDQQIDFEVFINAINNNEFIRRVPYWIEIKNNEVVSIAEKYVP